MRSKDGIRAYATLLLERKEVSSKGQSDLSSTFSIVVASPRSRPQYTILWLWLRFVRSKRLQASSRIGREDRESRTLPTNQDPEEPRWYVRITACMRQRTTEAKSRIGLTGTRC